nr:hypothetical protein [Methyloceanibacter sp.]
MNMRARRHQMLLSTAALLGSLTGYTRGVYAACPAAGGVCTGANLTTQTVSAPNATVTTDNTFFVDTTKAGGDALVISGAGAISYDDDNASDLTAPGNSDTALSITSTGDIGGGNDGSVFVDTGGELTGGDTGIFAENRGKGDAAINAYGDVVGTLGSGIFAVNQTTANDLSVLTGAGKTVKGGNTGIDGRNYGKGNTSIKADGNVEGTNAHGIYASNKATAIDLTVETGAGTSLGVMGGINGIVARNDGSGDTSVTTKGDVTGTMGNGIYAYNNNTANNLTVETGAGKTVKGGMLGINARNNGTGATEIKAYGKVYGGTGSGTFGIDVYNLNNASTSLTVTTGASSTIKASALGIRATNFGTGLLTVTANGYVQGTTTGIIADQKDGAGDLVVNTGAGSEIIGLSTTGSGIRALSGNSFTGNMRITANGTVMGAGNGIYAKNEGSGDTTITANGKVAGGASGDGIDARNHANTTDLTVETGAGSMVTSGDTGIFAENRGKGD